MRTFETFYPNLYVVLCGPPGVGKTVLTSRVWKFLSEIKDQHLASTSVTAASLMDDLREAERHLIMPDRVPAAVHFHSLKIVSNELGVLIPQYENDFMNKLTDIYDGHPFSERRRTKDLHFKLEAPQINMLAATTPAYLNNIMPEGAWDQGFISRVILVYSGEVVMRPLFSELEFDQKRYDTLVYDLKHIAKIYGEVKFSKDAADAISHWYLNRGEPRPDHPRLLHYNTRRVGHLIKLCLVATLSKNDSLVVELDDYAEALDWLVEAETYMPDIFKAMTAGGDGKAIDDLWHHAYTIYRKEQKPIAASRLIIFLQERVPAHSVARILQVMVSAEILKESIEKNGKCYVPKARKP